MDVFSVPWFSWLSLLALLRRLGLAGQSLAYTPRGAANALVRFGFSHIGGVAFCRSHMMFRNLHPEVRGALLVAETAAHRRGTHALPARPFVHKALRNKQLINIERRSGIFRLAFRVGDRAAQKLFNRTGSTFWRVTQRMQGILHALAANQVDHQPRLLRRHANMPRERV